MRKITSFFSLLASVPLLTSSVSAGTNKIGVQDLLQKIDGTTITTKVKFGGDEKEFKEFLSFQILYILTKVWFENSKNLFFNYKIIFDGKKFFENIQFWDEKAKTILTTEEQWKELIKEKGKVEIKVVGLRVDFLFTIFFHFDLIEPTPAETETLINNFDYSNQIFFMLFATEGIKQFFLKMTLADFLKNITDFFYKLITKFLLLDIATEPELKLKVYNNGHEITQVDLDQPGQLNLTFDYEYENSSKEVVKGTTITVFKITLH